MINMRILVLITMISVFLAGCAGGSLNLPPTSGSSQGTQGSTGQATPLPSEQPPVVSQPSREQTPPRQQQTQLPRRASDVSSSAVMSLLSNADKMAQAEQFGRAAGLLQRALNIEPRNPFVYQHLAAVRLKQGQPDQAEALARKSNSLAVNNPFVQGDNWALIARARQVAGNADGARKAQDKVQASRLRAAALR